MKAKGEGWIIAAVSALMSWLGILAVPVFILVGCNLIDYFTGLCAAKYRKDAISSYKGIRGIIKKVCMWLLIVVGWLIDTMLAYAISYIDSGFKMPYIVAVVVAVWLAINEIISILENIVDIGVDLPPFLMPLIKNIKNQVEAKADCAAAGENQTASTYNQVNYIEEEQEDTK